MESKHERKLDLEGPGPLTWGVCHGNRGRTPPSLLASSFRLFLPSRSPEARMRFYKGSKENIHDETFLLCTIEFSLEDFHPPREDFYVCKWDPRKDPTEPRTLSSTFHSSYVLGPLLFPWGREGDTSRTRDPRLKIILDDHRGWHLFLNQMNHPPRIGTGFSSFIGNFWGPSTWTRTGGSQRNFPPVFGLCTSTPPVLSVPQTFLETELPAPRRWRGRPNPIFWRKHGCRLPLTIVGPTNLFFLYVYIFNE